jgi:hypothetical protein
MPSLFCLFACSSIDAWQRWFMNMIESAVDPPPPGAASTASASAATVKGKDGTGTAAGSGAGGGATGAGAGSNSHHPTAASKAAAAAAAVTSAYPLSASAQRRAAVANAAQHTYDAHSLVNSLHPTHHVFSRIKTLFKDGKHPFRLPNSDDDDEAEAEGAEEQKQPQRGASAASAAASSTDASAVPAAAAASSSSRRRTPYLVGDLPRVRDRVLVLEWLIEYKVATTPPITFARSNRAHDVQLSAHFLFAFFLFS